MKIKRKVPVLLCLIVLFAITISGVLIFYRNHSEKGRLKIALTNAIYENADQELQREIIATYGERIDISFPESTEVLFANASKGDLLDMTFSAVLKMRIDTNDKEGFLTQLTSKCDEASSSSAQYLFDEPFVPSEIWIPQELNDFKVYNVTNGSLGIGVDKSGNVLIYLSYGTI